jgi:hypothetical protein
MSSSHVLITSDTGPGTNDFIGTCGQEKKSGGTLARGTRGSFGRTKVGFAMDCLAGRRRRGVIPRESRSEFPPERNGANHGAWWRLHPAPLPSLPSLPPRASLGSRFGPRRCAGERDGRKETLWKDVERGDWNVSSDAACIERPNSNLCHGFRIRTSLEISGTIPLSRKIPALAKQCPRRRREGGENTYAFQDALRRIYLPFVTVTPCTPSLV